MKPENNSVENADSLLAIARDLSDPAASTAAIRRLFVLAGIEKAAAPTKPPSPEQLEERAKRDRLAEYKTHDAREHLRWWAIIRGSIVRLQEQRAHAAQLALVDGTMKQVTVEEAAADIVSAPVEPEPPEPPRQPRADDRCACEHIRRDHPSSAGCSRCHQCQLFTLAWSVDDRRNKPIGQSERRQLTADERNLLEDAPWSRFDGHFR